MKKNNEKVSLYRQTINWIKDIPRKLEILLNNLYTMATTLSQVAIGVYTISKVVPSLQGYVAIGALVAGVIVTVDGVFRLGHFLLKRGE